MTHLQSLALILLDDKVLLFLSSVVSNFLIPFRAYQTSVSIWTLRDALALHTQRFFSETLAIYLFGTYQLLAKSPHTLVHIAL